MEEFDLKSEYASVKFVPKISWQEYLIDVLGGLVPGILFLVGNSFILFPSLYALIMSLRETEKGEHFFVYGENVLRSTQNTPSAIWIVTFLVIFFLAYTVGQLFYRRDPNEPDRKSFKWLMKKHLLKDPDCKGLKRLKIKFNLKYNPNKKETEELREEFASADPKHCQFPYSYYDKYLEKRGFDYLIPLVVWNDNVIPDGGGNIRSKCWINLFKTRLMYYHPDKCGTIIRNEAHIRMGASTWYVSKFLTRFGLLGLAISICAVFIARFYSNQFSDIMHAISWYAVPLVVPSMVAAFSSYFYWRILKFLHYQRLREILVVLDTYYVTYRQDPELMELPVINFKNNMKAIFKILELQPEQKKHTAKKGNVNVNASWRG